MNAFPVKFIIERGQVRTENSNKPHCFEPINHASFLPFPKSPVIAHFFREIGRADELGSGGRNLMKYGKAYGGADPELIEGDVSRITINYPDFKQDDGEQVDTPHVQKLIFAINGEMTRLELMEIFGLKDRIHFSQKYLQPAIELGFIEMTNPDKPKSSKQKYKLTAAGQGWKSKGLQIC